MTTPTWLTGFEYGLATPIVSGGGLMDLVTGNCTISSTVAHSGTYSLRCIASGTAFAFISRTIVGSPTTIIKRFYVYFDALPAADIIIWSATTTGHKIQISFKAADDKLYVGIDGALSTASTSAVQAGLWIMIDVKGNISANPWLVDWQIDNVAQTQNSTALGPESFTNLDIGISTKVVATLYYDDIILSVTSGDYPIGHGGTIALVPNADGTHNNEANVKEDSAGNDINGTTYPAWNKLDEIPWTSGAASDYVRQTNIGAADYCEIQFSDIDEGKTIIGVDALLEYASASALANTGGCIILDGATETTLWGKSGALADYSETTAFFKHAIVTPASPPFTVSTVNGLKCRFGYSNDADPDVYWLAIILEVAYKIPDDSILITNAAVSVEQKETADYVRMTNTAVMIEQAETVDYIRITNAAIMIEYDPNWTTIHLKAGSISSSSPSLTVSVVIEGTIINLAPGIIRTNSDTPGWPQITVVAGEVTIALDPGNISSNSPTILIVTGSPVTIYLHQGYISSASPQLSIVSGPVTIVLDAGVISSNSPDITIYTGGPIIINLKAGIIATSQSPISLHIETPGEYIVLDGYKYLTTQKTWRPAISPTISSRILLGGDLDAIWGTAQYIFSGEIVAPISPAFGYGSIDNLRETLAKKELFDFSDHYGRHYKVSGIGPFAERSLSPKWDTDENIIYVTAQFKGILI